MNHGAIYTHSPATGKKITANFSREEIRQLTARSDWMGVWAIASVWGSIAVCLVLIGWAWSQPLYIGGPALTLGVALLGGRQLALAIITHEATHRTLFKTRWANDWLTDWLCARPIGLDLGKYRSHHFVHHTKTGTDEDSDISLVRGLPTTRTSLARKLARDLAGITGLKFLLGRLMMDAELIQWTVATDVVSLPRRSAGYHFSRFVRNAFPTILTNLALAGILVAVGHGELYGAWLAAYLIPYPLFIRIRALAEHAGTELSADMFKNTRTTRAGLLARMFVAPLKVNYHLEHHAMASVPWFRLPVMHRLLRERDMTTRPPSYWQVLAIVSSGPVPTQVMK